MDNLILSARCSFDLPFVARMRTGRGPLSFKSGNKESGEEEEYSGGFTEFLISEWDGGENVEGMVRIQRF